MLEALEEESELSDLRDSEAFCREQASRQQPKPSKASTFKCFIPTPPSIYMIALSLENVKMLRIELESNKYHFLAPYNYSSATAGNAYFEQKRG